MRLRHGKPRRAHCPLCRVELEPEADPVEACRECKTEYHRDCLHELGGCATLGCALKGVATGPRRERAPLSPHEQQERRKALRREHQDRLRREDEAYQALVSPPKPEEPERPSRYLDYDPPPKQLGPFDILARLLGVALLALAIAEAFGAVSDAFFIAVGLLLVVLIRILTWGTEDLG